MRKKRAGSFGFWLFFLVLLSGTALYAGSIYVLFGAVSWFLVPLVSLLLNLGIRGKLETAVEMPVTAAKKKSMEGCLSIRNKSMFPAARIDCSICIRNRLTGETKRQLLNVSVAPGQKSRSSFTVASEYCGYLESKVEGIWLMDWMGFLPLKCKTEAAAGTSVLPDTFIPDIYLNLTAVQSEEAQDWSPFRKGNDQTEVFALRDYVPGDSLKQIHWKLSSKKRELIVKEASFPMEKSLLIFWDKNTGAARPGEMDAMAECVSSLSQAVQKEGYSFMLGWTEGRQLCMEEIDNEEQLLQAIPRMVKYGRDDEAISGSALYDQKERKNSYGKVLYLAKTLPEDFIPIPCTDLTLLLCEKEEKETEWRTVYFGADTYPEDLENQEL